MGAKSKQIALYMALVLICSTYTLIAPFYPKIAKEKGIPLWLIGIVFATNPFGNMVTSLILGRHLITIGRKNVVIASYFFTALSMLIMSPIEYFDKTLVIILSFLSRFIGGVGSCCLFVTVTTIFASDFPDQIQVMIGRMEACIGLGLIIGPMLGTGLYSMNLIIAMPSLAAFILVFTPVIWKMLGTFQNYELVERNINRLNLFTKPKIILCILMNVSFLFSFGFLASMLEVHLSSYGLNTLLVSVCFVLESVIYFILSLSGGYIFKSLDPRLVMLIGQVFMIFAFLFLGPWSLILPNNLWVVIASLPLFSFGQNMTYMFSIGYMVQSAIEEYGFHDDDYLMDTISSFSSLGCSFGEIIGPIFAGFITDFLGIENCCLIASAMGLVFAVVYFFGTGYAWSLCRRSKDEALIVKKKVVPENISMQRDILREV